MATGSLTEESCHPEELDARDMSRLVHGHETALNDLMDRHAEKLFHYLLRSLQNEEDAADLAQETFVKVYQHRGKFDARQKFSTWLYAIATNLVKDKYRWRSRHPQASLEADHGHSEANLKDNLRSDEPAPDETLQKHEAAEAVRNAIATLPDELRQPLILSIYEELPQGEIALILNCSVKAVETRIYRARQRLRTFLGPRITAS